VDILALTTAQHAIVDWELFLDIVKQSRTAGAVYWALWLARTWIDAPVPDLVLQRLAPPALTRGVLAGILEPRHILDRELPAEGQRLLRLLFDLSYYGGCTIHDQFAYLWGRLVAPTGAAAGQSPLRRAADIAGPERVVRLYQLTAATCRLLARRGT
jgi:hypothetical protein